MQPKQLSFIKTSGCCLLCSLLISCAMMADSPYDLRIALENKAYSIYYLFFDTIIFCGMFGNYYAAIICTVPFSKAYLHDYNSGRVWYMVFYQGKRNYIIKQFLKATIGSGICLSLGYCFFILILSLKLPFVNYQDIDSGLNTLPYVHYAFEGKAFIHQIIICYYGFLTGSLWGAAAILSSAFIHDHLTVLAIPFFSRFLIVQIYRIFVVPETYRLDSWLYMFTIYHSEPATLVISTVSIILIGYIMYFIFYYKIRKDVFYGNRFTGMSTKRP